jgi:hypothetical protein
VKIMLPYDPTGQAGCTLPQPDVITHHPVKEASLPGVAGASQA